MTELTDPGFAPADPADDRDAGEWETRYKDPDAKKEIAYEAKYLGVHLFGVLLIVFLVAFFGEQPELVPAGEVEKLPAFGWYQLLHGWLGGVLGGTAYSIKWLVHVVAKHLWNLDRRLWRVMTPHVSGALAFAFVILMASGFVKVIDQNSMRSAWVCMGLGFLIGYFSDNATAKLSEMATTLFGASRQPAIEDDDGSR